MPYLKSRQYALLHLEQMKEVVKKLYDLASGHNMTLCIVSKFNIGTTAMRLRLIQTLIMITCGIK